MVWNCIHFLFLNLAWSPPPLCLEGLSHALSSELHGTLFWKKFVQHSETNYFWKPPISNMRFVNLKDNFESQESCSLSHNSWSIRLNKYKICIQKDQWKWRVDNNLLQTKPTNPVILLDAYALKNGSNVVFALCATIHQHLSFRARHSWTAGVVRLRDFTVITGSSMTAASENLWSADIRPGSAHNDSLFMKLN